MSDLAFTLVLCALIFSISYCTVHDGDTRAAYKLECLKAGKTIDNWNGNCK